LTIFANVIRTLLKFIIDAYAKKTSPIQNMDNVYARGIMWKMDIAYIVRAVETACPVMALLKMGNVYLSYINFIYLLIEWAKIKIKTWIQSAFFHYNLNKAKSDNKI
jgi:hypothetical protein